MGRMARFTITMTTENTGSSSRAVFKFAEFTPAMTKDSYLAFERDLFRTERYKPEVSE